MRPVTLSVLRGGKQFDCSLMAVKPLNAHELRALPWASFPGWSDTNVTLLHPAPMEQIQASATQIFNTLGAPV